MAAVLDRAMAQGLADPAAHLEEGQAHPTDSHPPTRERAVALVQAIDADLLAAAGAVPPPHALGQLAAYFADPAALCRAATEDFLGAVHAQEAAVRAHLEATAADVGDEERVLQANHRARGLALAVGGGLFAVVALAVALFGIPGIRRHEVNVILFAASAFAVLLGGAGAFILRRGDPVSLTLSPRGLTAPGLDRTIPWDDIADLDMTFGQGAMVTRLLLPPGAAFPKRIPGRRTAKLDPKRRIVTLVVGLPRGMKPQAFADLIRRYQAAHQARQILARQILAQQNPAGSHVTRPAAPETRATPEIHLA